LGKVKVPENEEHAPVKMTERKKRRESRSRDTNFLGAGGEKKALDCGNSRHRGEKKKTHRREKKTIKGETSRVYRKRGGKIEQTTPGDLRRKRRRQTLKKNRLP